MKNVALFGGSFDPPTLGHMMVVSHLLLNDSSVDEVWVIPCFLQTGKNLTPFMQRFWMAKKAFEVFNRVRILKIEQELGGESVTSRTIQALSDQYSDCKFRFIIGSDLQDSIKTWEGADVIQKLAPPLIIGRAGIPNSSDATPISPLVSSTIVRKALDEGRTKDAERYLSASVLKYIIACNLYSGKLTSDDSR